METCFGEILIIYFIAIKTKYKHSINSWNLGTFLAAATTRFCVIAAWKRGYLGPRFRRVRLLCISLVARLQARCMVLLHRRYRVSLLRFIIHYVFSCLGLGLDPVQCISFWHIAPLLQSRILCHRPTCLVK